MAGLPDTIEALQALLTEGREVREALEAEIRTLKRRIASLERAPPPRPVAARIAGTQLEFPLDSARDASAAAAAQATLPTRGAATLVRERVILEPWLTEDPALCPTCAGPLAQAGLDLSESLEYLGGEYRLIEYVRPKSYCSACRQTLQAPPPPRPIPRALPGPGMLAHVLTARYERHLSLYRQQQLYAAAGVNADRSTLADWIETSWLLLEPLADALARHVLAGSHLLASSMAYPIRAHGTGRTRCGRLWLYVRDERPWGSQIAPAAWLRFTTDRSGAQARAHLSGFGGTLQGAGLDEEPIYHSARIQLLGCWAELRARIERARGAHESGLVEEWLQRIDALYDIECALVGRPSEVRRLLRLERSQPLLDALHSRLRTGLRDLPKKAELATVVRFALAHWKRLERYIADGRAQMDGMDAQRLLQQTVGTRATRGADTHGARAAGLYGLIATARLNGTDPEQYLRVVLEHLSAEVPSNWDALLPWALSS